MKTAMREWVHPNTVQYAKTVQHTTNYTGRTSTNTDMSHGQKVNAARQHETSHSLARREWPQTGQASKAKAAPVGTGTGAYEALQNQRNEVYTTFHFAM